MTSRRPLPPAPNGSSGFTAGSRASSGSVAGVVASRLAAMASAGSTTNGGLDSNSRIPSYRLSSLDRLAQRQRLFEGQPAAATTNGTSTPLHSTDTVSFFLFRFTAMHMHYDLLSFDVFQHFSTFFNIFQHF